MMNREKIKILVRATKGLTSSTVLAYLVVSIVVVAIFFRDIIKAVVSWIK